MSDPYSQLLQQMMQSGQEMLQTFNPGAQAQGQASAAGAKAYTFPTMTPEMMEMWFGQTFNRSGLDAKTRLLTVIAALTVQGVLSEPQYSLTLRHALASGANIQEISEVIWQMSLFSGLPAMQKGLDLARAVSEEEASKARDSSGHETGADT